MDREKDFDAMVAKTFRTPTGKRVLEYLTERYIKSPVCMPGREEGQGYYREGQNSVIRMFHNAILRQERGDYRVGEDNE